MRLSPSCRCRSRRWSWLALLPALLLATRALRAEPQAGEEQASAGNAPPSGNIEDLAGMSLEELLDVKVVTATKTERKVSEAPAAISVLTRKDITRWGYQTLAEALQHVVGFYVVDDYTIPNAGVRGVAGGLFGESSGIKLMIDGRSVAFRATGGNWLGPELVPLSVVERIEIIRGPSSALYGADAFLAVVNVITREGKDLSGGDVRAAVDFSSVSDAGADLDLASGARRGPVAVVLSARIHRDDHSGLSLPESSPAPEVPDYRANDRFTRRADANSVVTFGKATYHYDERNKLSAVAYHSTFERGAEFSPWLQLSSGLDEAGRFHETRIALQQSAIGLVQESSFGEGAGLTLRGHYFTGGPTSADRIDVGSEIFEVRRDFGYEGLEGSAETRFDIGKSLGAVAGAEVLVEREHLPSSLLIAKVASADSSAGEVVEASSTRQGDKTISNTALYLQALWTAPEPFLSLIGGARYDQHGIYGGQFSARTGAISRPAESVHVKVLYGSAFKAPSPLLLYGVPYKIGDIVGNPELEPQRVHTVEGQVSYEPKKGIVATTGLSYSRLLNKAEFVTQGVNRVARNLSDVGTLSWETELSLSYESWLAGYASFELPYTVRDLGQQGYQADLVGERNVIYPEYIARMGVSASIPGAPLRAALEAMQVGARRASEMNILERGESYELDPYLMLDASVSTVGIELLDERETALMLKGRNLLDVSGPAPGFVGVDYPLEPLSVLVQLRQEL